MASSRLSATKIGVGALIALTLSTAVATVINLQEGRAESVPTAVATSPASTDRGASETAQYAIDLLGDRTAGTDNGAREKTFADLLPNHTFQVGSAEPVALASGIVIGTVTGVEPGSAYSADAGSDAGSELDFADPDALWREIVLTVSVDSAVGEVSGDATVRIGLAIDGTADIDKATAGFESLGRIIAVLDGPGAFAFDPEVYSVRQGGGLVGLVAENGSISFPYLGEKNAEFLDGLDTVTDVLTEATGPDVISKVERAGASPSQD